MAQGQPSEYDQQMDRHRARRDIKWVPYCNRPSLSGMSYDQVGSVSEVCIVVAGLGSMTLRTVTNNLSKLDGQGAVTLTISAADKRPR
jgi:hypothetical protein